MKNKLIFTFILFLSYSAFSQSSFPRFTLHVDSVIKEQFYESIDLLAEKYFKGSIQNIHSIQLGISYLEPIPLGLNLSYMYFKNFNDWFYLPVFGAVAGSIHDGSSFSLGSGIIFTNQYFVLGLYGAYYNGTMIDNIHEIKTSNFNFGIFPVFNIAEYPILGFLEKIDGFLTYNEPKTNDYKLNAINFLARLVFKRFFRLPVFEIYSEKGYNDFSPAYDFSSFSVNLYGSGFNHKYSLSSPVNSLYDRIYETINFGLLIGGDIFNMEFNYLIVSGLKALKRDYYGEVTFEDYEYPFGLNGFPSVTFNIYDEDWGGFIKFSAIKPQGTWPYVPDIGFTFKTDNLKNILVGFIAIYSFPMVISSSMRFTM